MIRALQLIWPPWWALGMVGFLYAAFEALYLFFEWRMGALLFSPFGEKGPAIGALSVFALFYVAYRVWTFHPAMRPDYYQWLASTPWTSSQPLPLGPIHLVWQDLLLVGIGVAVGWPRLQTQALIPAQVFLFAYLAGLAFTLGFTEAGRWSYGIVVGLGFMALFARHPQFFVGAAAASYGIAYLGVRSALARFPWQDSIDGAYRNIIRQTQPLGWSHDRLGPPRTREFPLGIMFALGLLIGWWWYVLATHGFVHVPFYPTVLLLAVIRLFVYCNGYLPPISLAGRLAAGRWIIPSYDQVFVAPVLALMVGVAAWFVVHQAGWDAAVVQPIALTLTIWITFGIGPSPRVWQLTGNHRIVAGVIFQQRR